MRTSRERSPIGAWLRRNWFVAAITGVVGMGVAAGPQLRGLDARLPLSSFIVAIMLVTAVGLPHRDIGRILRRPGPVLLGVAVGYTLMPAGALWLGSLLGGAPRDLAVGLLIAGAAPCTLASAVIWTRLAGGDEMTALLITLLSNLLSCVATSAWVTAGTGTVVRLEFTDLMRQLAIVIALPVGAGQALRMRPSVAQWVTARQTALSVVARCLILTVVLSAAVKAGIRLRETPLPWPVVGRVAAFCLALHLAGWSAAWVLARTLFRFERRRSIGAAFGASQKTLPVGLYLARTFFPQLGLAGLPILIYHVTQLVTDTWIANALARRAGPPRPGVPPRRDGAVRPAAAGSRAPEPPRPPPSAAADTPSRTGPPRPRRGPGPR